MILTLTPNPTIDRVVFCRGFRLGGVVRAEGERVTPSGKGVDASLVLHELGSETCVLGLQAGLNGRLHAELLDQWGIAHDMLPAAGETRMATVLVDLAVKQQSTITAPTLTAGEEQLVCLLDQLQGYAGRAWGLIFGGSLPPGLPADSYARLIRRARALGLLTLLDTSGDALRHGVGGVPHVLKVNHGELQALLAANAGVHASGSYVDSVGARSSHSGADEVRVDVDALAAQLSSYLGVWASEALVITLGKGGALAVTTEGAYWARPPVVPVVNTAGAGDALDAGLMLARSRGDDWGAALRLGTAAAVSVVMHEGTAICQREQVEELRPRVQIDRLTAKADERACRATRAGVCRSSAAIHKEDRSMSTSREIVDALLRGKKAERVAVMGAPWADTIAAWVEQGYPTRVVHKQVGENRWRRDDGRYTEVEVAGEYEEPVPTWEHFGYDMVGVGPWFDILPLRGHSELEEETDEWEVRRNGAGAALKFWKHKSGTPEHIDFRMTTREVWERDYRPHLLELDPRRVKADEMRANAAKLAGAEVWTHYGHMFVWESMRQSMGDVTLYQSLLLDPDWVHDYNRVYTDLFKAHFQYMFDQVGKPDGIWIYEDLGYKNGLFASPKVLEEIIFPYYAELNAFFHEHDLPVVLHTCGSTAAALPLIVEAGFDALNPMERKAKDNDPFGFAEKYGDQIAFVGGLDARVLESNDRDLIRREVTAYVEGMKARGARLIFASDHSISTNTRYESYCYGLAVYREHMMYD